MGDMAPRPRGGWQVGSRIPSREMVDDGTVDEAPDVYTVHKRGRDDTTFSVRHYPTPEAARPCCTVTVTITDEDRQDRLGPAIAALTRAYLEIEGRHRR